jgi:hypothetical protein
MENKDAKFLGFRLAATSDDLDEITIAYFEDLEQVNQFVERMLYSKCPVSAKYENQRKQVIESAYGKDFPTYDWDSTKFSERDALEEKFIKSMGITEEEVEFD